MKSARIRAYLALVSAALIWGIAGVVIKATLDYLSPLTFLFLRFGVVFIFVLPLYLYYLRKHRVKFFELLRITPLAFLGTVVYLSLVFFGFDRTTAIDGTLIESLTPVFIIILGVLFLNEKVTRHEKWGIGLVTTGTVITVLQPFLEGKTFAWENSLGNFLVLLAGLAWAFFVLYSKRNFAHFPPVLVTLHSAIVAFFSFAVFAFFAGFPDLTTLLSLPKIAVFGVLYMGFFSYLLAYLIYEYGMSKIAISEGTIFTYLIPVFTAPFAFYFLHETVSWPFLIGAGVIFAGVVLSEWK